MKKGEIGELEVGIAELSEVLDLGQRQIHGLVRTGVLLRSAPGRYPLVPCVRGYVESLRARAVTPPELQDARARKLSAEAELREFELAKMRGSTVSIEDVESMLTPTLEALSVAIRTAPRNHSRSVAKRLGCTQAEAMAIIREIAEDLKAAMLQAALDAPDYRPGSS